MPVQPPEPPRRTPASARRSRHPELERDEGMARTTTATRWIAVGGLAGVGVFAALAAVSTHHASADPTTPAVIDAPVATDAPAASTDPAPASSATTVAPATTPTTVAPVAPAEQAPASVPQRTRRTPVATSGGS